MRLYHLDYCEIEVRNLCYKSFLVLSPALIKVAPTMIELNPGDNPLASPDLMGYDVIEFWRIL